MSYYNLISSMNKAAAPSYDADALAYLTNGDYLANPTIASAYNDFYLGLKADGDYPKIRRLWTFQNGGNSLGPKLNLINPIDSDAAHRITYVGSPTINSTGIDCTSGCCDLHMTPLANLTLNDTTFMFESATDSNGVFYDVFSSGCIQIFSRLSNLFLSDMYNLSGAGGRILVSNTSSDGRFAASRLPLPTHTLFIDSVQVATNSTTDGSLGTFPIYFGGNNSGSYSGRTYKYSLDADGLTPTEIARIEARLVTLMTALGR